MKINDIIHSRNRYNIAYKSYVSVIWNFWIGKKKIKVILQKGNSNYVSNNLVWNYSQLIASNNVHIYDLHLDSNSIKFTYNGKSITMEDNAGDIGAVFGHDDYSFLDVENEIVIDIGANIGDSQYILH